MLFRIVYQLVRYQRSEVQNDTKLQGGETPTITKAMWHYPHVKLCKARAAKTLKTSL